MFAANLLKISAWRMFGFVICFYVCILLLVNCVDHACPVGSKTQNGRFPCKVALHLKKVCYKVSSCEHCRRQSCKAFIGLSTGIHIKMIRGISLILRLLLRENLAETDQPSLKTPISNKYSLVAPQPYHLAQKSSIDTNRKSSRSRAGLTIRGGAYQRKMGPFSHTHTQNFLSRGARFFSQKVDDLFSRRRYVSTYTARSNVNTEWKQETHQEMR